MSFPIHSLDLAYPKKSLEPHIPLHIQALDLHERPCHYQLSCRGYINYLGPRFRPLDEISIKNMHGLLEKEILRTRKVSINCFSFAQAATCFTFKGSGFCVTKLPSLMNPLLRQLQLDFESRDSRAQARLAIEKHISDWGKEQGMDFTHAVAVDAVCRSTDTEDHNPFRAVTLSHIDFTSDTQATLAAFLQAWKPRVENALKKKISDKEYIELDVVQMVNVWMPLNTFTHKNTLALLDKTTTSLEAHHPYTAVRKEGSFFSAQIVAQEKQNAWSICDIRQGEALVFDSQVTAHTAVDVSRKYVLEHQGRKSVEIRVILLKDHSEA